MSATTGEQTIRQLVEAWRDPSMIVRVDGTAELVNAAFVVRTGLDRERFEGFGWLRALHQGEAASTYSFWASRLAAGQPFEVDIKLRAYDGQHHAHRVEAWPIDLARWFVSFTPLQEYVVRVPAPRVGDDSLRALMFDHVREAAFAWELEPRPRILLWNAAAEQLYGFSFAEVVQRSPHSVLRTVFPVSEAHTTAALRRDRQWSGELRHTTRAGELRVIDAHLELVDLGDGRTVVLESARDVTARRRDEHAVIDGAARLRLALSAAKMATWEWDIATGRLYWSPEHFAMLGVDPASFTGRLEDFSRLVHPEDAEALWATLAKALDTLAEIDLEFRVRRPDGGVRTVQNKALIERSPLGQAVRLIGTLTDVTEARLTEARLRESEQRFRALADALPQLVWHYTNDERWTPDWVNARTEAVLGLSLGVLRDGGWSQIVHPDDLEAFMSPWPTATLTAGSREHEARLRIAGGAYRWFLLRAVPDRSEGGDIRGWFTTATDIDDRRQLEDAARARASEVSALLDAVPAAVWITHDRDTSEVHGNAFGARLLRSDPMRNLSKTGDDPDAVAHFSVWQDGRELAPHELPLQRAARGEVIRNFSEEIRFADGNVVHVYGNAMPIRGSEGEQRGAVAAFVDVTTLHDAERQLREIARRKDDFLAMLSHEMRNPLAALVSAAQVIREQGDVITVRQREVLERQSAQLAKLVDDLLDVSRISRGKIDLERRPIEVSRLLDRALEAVKPEGQRKRITLEVLLASEELVLDVDDVRFVQVLTNVLANAVRYTPEGGAIAVNTERLADEAVIRISDNGIGIPAELLPSVFEMFVQGRGHSAESGEGGLGLGLPISRRLVELHGGTMAIASEGAGRGTTVTIRVPVSRRRVSRVGSRPSLTAATAPRRVLVVDDNGDAADLLGMLLSAAGHEVAVAYDSTQALQVADRHKPEVAILDLGLPDIDGVELGQRLRRALPALRLVALTGHVTEADRQRSAAFGFGDHVAKPVSVQALLQLLDRQ